MNRVKASITALALALMLSISVALYKPADHEDKSESPTVDTADTELESEAVVAPPIEDKPIEPPEQPNAIITQEQPVQPVTQTFEITHYTESCKGCSGITASGVDIRGTVYYNGYRIVAAPRSIPFYTTMQITYEDGTTFKAIVLDRGGNIGQGRLDLLVASYDEAIQLGRQQVSVEILN